MKFFVGALILLSFYEVSGFHFDIKNGKVPCLIVDMASGNGTLRLKGKPSVPFMFKDNAGISKGACALKPKDNSSFIAMQVSPNVTLTFNFTVENGNYLLHAMSLKWTLNLTDFEFVHEKIDRTLAPLGSYYQCQSSVDTELTNAYGSATVTIKGVKLQAFNVTGGNFSKKGDVCPEDKKSTPSPFTTPRPAPPKPARAAHFKVKDFGKKIYCIVGEFIAKFEIEYTKKVNPKKNETAKVKAVLNSKTLKGTSGNCGENEQRAVLNWRPVARGNIWKVTLNFKRDSVKATSYVMHNFTLTFKPDNKTFPNATDVKTDRSISYKSDSLSTYVGGYYICNSSVHWDLEGDNHMITSNLTISAFRTSNSTKFDGTASHCFRDSASSKIVPIAVGVALAVLVLIVIIVYLVGRRRRLTGYQSI